MKITISYQPGEQHTAAAVFQAAKQLLPRARVHKVDSKPPFTHLYLTSKSGEQPKTGRTKD